MTDHGAPPPPEGDPSGLVRGEFLRRSGAAGLGAYLLANGLVDDALGALVKESAPNPGGTSGAPVLTHSVKVRRREDLLWLRLDFYNLVLTDGKPRGLKRVHPGGTSYLVVGFPPQNVAEQAFYIGSEQVPKPGAARSRLATPARLAFRFPPTKSLPHYELEALLHFAGLVPSLAPAAAAPAGSHSKVLRAPKPTETQLELPWRLALSPRSGAAWSHDPQPVTKNGWTELWHLRLGTRLRNGGFAEGGPVRAVWTFDEKFDPKGEPPGDEVPGPAGTTFRTSLSAHDRAGIVRATSDFGIKGRADVVAQRLWLTSLGGWLDSRGVWDLNAKKTKLAIEEWRHRATLGRDHYVRVIDKGFLFPSGHRAVRVKITERKFVKVGARMVAANRQRVFLVVRQPVKTYPGSFGLEHDGRALPFSTLRVTTLVTPDLKEPSTTPFVTNAAIKTDAWIPTPVGSSAPFRFHFVGTDWSGRHVEFTLPSVFVAATSAYIKGRMTTIRDAYNNEPPDADLRTGAFTGQTVAFAPPVKAGDTDVEVKTIAFGAAGGKMATDDAYSEHDQPRCFPTVTLADVRIGAAEQASGGKPLTKPDGTPLPSSIVSYPGAYLSEGFGAANKGRVFLEVQSAAPRLTFGEGSAGGVITPNFAITALSRSLGPVGGTPATIHGGAFSPEDFFAGVEARILGGVNLFDVFAGAPLDGDEPPAEAMKLTYRTTADAQETRLHWQPKLKPHPVVRPDGTASFVLDAVIRTDLADPSKSTYDVNGDLKSFLVSLIGSDPDGAQFIEIHFRELRFRAKKGQKSQIDVDIAAVEFVGALHFVNALREYMDFSGEGGPRIDVTPGGISADLSVPIPSLQLGVFAISNIKVVAGFFLPFDGKPARFRFGFSSREDPFALQVAIFGGGGFFAIAIGTDGVEQIEASLEFGAMAAIDIGVASGSVHLLAGVYFSYGTDPVKQIETCVLTGFVRLGGELSILGLVHLSLEFYLGLTYQSAPEKVYGQATLTVMVEVLCFSKSVSMTAKRQFGNSESDPPFAEQISAGDWNAYCDAYTA